MRYKIIKHDFSGKEASRPLNLYQLKNELIILGNKGTSSFAVEIEEVQ